MELALQEVGAMPREMERKKGGPSPVPPSRLGRPRTSDVGVFTQTLGMLRGALHESALQDAAKRAPSPHASRKAT